MLSACRAGLKILWLAAAAACVTAAPAATAGETDPGALVAAAIAQLRGHPAALLRSGKYDTLDRDLNAARKVLYDNRAAALEAIRPILENERQDSFLIIDLANVLVAMESDRDSQTLAAAAIERANVALHPRGTVQALALMASRQCGPCLPAMFRVLELINPRPTIPELGRALNPDEVIIFSLGQYGDAALPGLLAALASDNCTVRANAAYSLRWVRPDEVPAALREMARTDFCHGARDAAWHVLGEMDDPQLPDLARRRLAASPPPDPHLRRSIADGLVTSHVPAALEVLQSLRGDHSPEVEPVVRGGLDPKSDPRKWIATIHALAQKPVPPAERARRVEALEHGARDGRYKMEERLEVFVTSLSAEDIPLVDRTRASILRQLSAESLLHYMRLTSAVRLMRMLRDTPRPVD